MISWEIKKILKSKSFIASVGLFMLLILIMSFLKPTLETENVYYNKNEYVVDERVGNVIANEKLAQKVEELSELGKLKKLDKKDKIIEKISDMAEEKLKKDSGEKYEDINFYKILNFRISNGLASILMTIILIVILSNIYTEERLSNVDSIILSSKNKNKTLYSKLTIAIIIPIVIYGLYVLIIGMITYIQYGKAINGGLQAYRIVNIPYILRGAPTINEYIGITIVTIILLYTIMSVYSSFCSFVTNNSISSVVGSTVILIAFKVAMLIKSLPDEALQVLKNTNFIDIYMFPEMFVGAYKGNINLFGNSIDLINLSYSVLGGLLVVGILLNLYIFKKVLNK